MDFFLLVLEIPSKLTLNIIDKSLRVTKIFLQKDYQLEPRNQCDALIAALDLNPT